MLQQLLRRLVFDVPLLSEYCKMPLKVNTGHYLCILLVTIIQCCLLCYTAVTPSSIFYYTFYLSHYVLGMSNLNRLSLVHA